MNYKIYDNFLDEQNFLSIKNIMMGDSFPWFFNEKKTSLNSSAIFLNGEKADEYDFQFTHTFYKDMVPWSEQYGLVLPLVEKIGAKALVRIKANLTTKTTSRVYYGNHTDSNDAPQNLKTAVFYINNNNGVTAFKDGPEIQSIENRLVIFDTNLVHTGTSCTDEKTRCLVNINFYDQ